MAFVEWKMQGTIFVNCNCDIGCPCQFNSLPSKGNCRAFTFVQIDQGKFGDVPLDGLRWGGLYAWPKAIHEGNGTAMPVVEERANPKQRAALEAIAHGKETDPGSLITQVFASTLTKALPTQFKPIDLSIDPKSGTARVKVAGIVEGSAEPVKNPMNGAPHRARIVLPQGFEYTECEVLSGTGKAPGEIALDFRGTHAHVARIHWSTHGVVR